MPIKSAIVIALEKVANAIVAYNLSFVTVKPKVVYYPIVHTKVVIWNSTYETFFATAHIRVINCNRSWKICPL